MANKVIHKRSIQKGLLPSGTTLDYGEIAVNYNSGEPFLSIRTTESGKTDTNYAKFIDEAAIDAKIKNVENQNAFSKVAVSGKSTIEADSATDTLTFAAGSNISITTDASNDKITIAATGLSQSGHTHDDRYYTESEINALLNKKSDTGHTHSQYSETGHTHDGVYKPVQAIVSDPTASGNSTTFIDTISQNENGVITATKKTVNFSNYKPVQTSVSDPTASGSSTTFIATIEQDKNGVITPTKKTVKLANALTFGTKSFDGSSAQTITASDLGLGSALKYCGITTTALTDGATTNPIKINNANHTATAGCVVFYGDKEFVFNGANWELLGAEATYKVVQTAVPDPTASTATTTTFISNIEQDKNGVIAATKKTVPIAKFDTLGLVKPSKSYTGAATLTTAAASTTTAPTINAITTTAGKYYAVEVDKNGVPFVNVPWSDTNTDTKVTSVDNHYTPTPTTAHTISKDASSTTKATWGSTSLVTGVNIERDAKGHVTNVTLDSIQMPSNPDSHYTTHMYLGSSTATADATSDVTNPYIRLFDNTTAREDIQVSGGTNISVKGKNGVITIDGTHNHDGIYLKEHQTIYNLTLSAGTFSADTFDPNGAAKTVYIPTHTSHITNNSGYITSATTVSKANQLATARTLWGQSFNGSANISGAISSTGNITPSVTDTSTLGSASLKYKEVHVSNSVNVGSGAINYNATTGCMEIIC